MKNSVRLLLSTICVAALLAGGFMVSHGIVAAKPAHKSFKIVIVTKAETISVFQDVDAGAAVAAKELGDSFAHYGPSTPDAAKQHDIIVNQVIPTHPDAIGASANDPNVVGSALKQAQNKGIKTFAWDSDVATADRAVFVNQVFIPLVGKTLANMACQDAPGCSGQMAILSATTTSTNQNAWIAAMKAFMKSHKHKFRKLHLVKIAYGNDDPAKSTTESEGLLSAFPNLKVIVAPTSVGIVAASQVVRSKGLKGKVFVTGLGFAKEMAAFIRAGIAKHVALWSFKDLGYLSLYVGHALAAGKFTGKVGQTIRAGKLGFRTVKAGRQILLGPLQIYTKANINHFVSHGSICCG